MKINSEGKLLKIFIGESDNYQGHPLYEVILRTVKERGLSGATVLRGIEGYGANSALRSTRLIDLSNDLPIVIEIIDEEENIQMILPLINQLIEKVNAGALLTLESVQIVKYSPSKPM